jgi:ABC-type transporter Mla subunit MlaD
MGFSHHLRTPKFLVRAYFVDVNGLRANAPVEIGGVNI